MKYTARDTAFSVLFSCRKNAGLSDVNLKSALDKAKLDKRDSALASRICYGVMQNLTLIDFYLSAFCSRPFSKLEPAVPDILRIGAYQILFMDRIPDEVAVSEAVEMTKRRASIGASKLVNAVLRSLSRSKSALPAIPDEDKAEYLSVRYSHPKWFAERMISLLGEDGTEAFFAANNAEAPITVRVNTMRTDTDTVLGSLSGDGIEAEAHKWLRDSIVFSAGGDIRTAAAFNEGLIYVQDPAATLAAAAASPRRTDKVLDVCAAPGGKSFSCVMLSGGCKVSSRDLTARKAYTIAEGAARLGIEKCISASAVDAKVGLDSDKDAFDVVLADVPCSGMGIIRKKPDIRFKREEDISALPDIQFSILTKAAEAVKPGGTLIYSTCTVLPEENGDVVTRFLAARSDFYTQDVEFPAPVGKTCGGMITLWPHINGTDGFFICRMRRKK